jgi:hypothetical protein
MADEKQDEIDRLLDAALAKYAAEPRAGLEERVLANLLAERARVPVRAWWRWSVAGAVLAVVFVAVALAWRSGKSSHPNLANHPPKAIQGVLEPATQAASNRDGAAVPPRSSPARRLTAPRLHQSVAIAAPPKLYQFPSPRPLSEQERILANYVAEYPEHAVLVARAMSEALQQDQLEEMKPLPSGGPASDLEKRNNNTTER